MRVSSKMMAAKVYVGGGRHESTNNSEKGVEAKLVVDGTCLLWY